ncbi:hypothetical protein MUP32_05625 [Candidatus Microgenomates bacterium]|nr:hypothetical protein [Candidatus Microgenomates bacterium]
MAFGKSVIFLQRDKINYYDNSLPGVLTLSFTPDIIKDLEVINPPSLHLHIKSFIDNNKISPSQTLIVLSTNVYFEKDFPDSPEFHQDSELQKYIDTFPFENVSTKIYKLATGSKLLATNSDLYQNIKSAFEKTGFIIEAVVPIIVLGKDVAIADKLDEFSAKTILERFDLAKQNSLSIHQDLFSQNQNPKDKKGKKDDNLTLIFLLPVLFILIIVLVILYFRTSPAPQPQALPMPSITESQVSPSPIETATPTVFPSMILNQDNTGTGD